MATTQRGPARRDHRRRPWRCFPRRASPPRSWTTSPPGPGCSKGALYLYFETKQDLFRAVVRETIAPNLEAVAGFVGQSQLPFGDLIRLVFARIAEVITEGQLGAVAKMVIGESRNFPELAKVWHEDVVSVMMGAMSRAVAAAQARGEVRPGDPQLYVFSLAGPVLLGVLWREVFEPTGVKPLDLKALLAQHAEVALKGMLLERSLLVEGEGRA